MTRQKKRPASEEAEQPALPVKNPGAGGGEKAKESSGIAAFLPSSWRQDWLLGLFLVAVTVMAYQPVWHAGFIWDDDLFLTNNPVIKSANGLYRIWFTTSTPDYFPVTSSMLWLEWRVWANHPLGYHLVNVLLHGFSAVLLWRVLLRLDLPGALLAAAFFALHPVNVESVAWITERKNTLCMFFYLGTLLAWLKFEDSGLRRWYGVALAGFALALLSKTAVAPLPIVLLGMAWWRRGRVGWKDVRQVVPFFVIAAALGLVTVWFQSQRAIGHIVVRTDGFWSRLAGAGWAVWFYLYKAVLPLNLTFVYPRWQIDVQNVLTYIPLVMLAIAFVWCWRCWRGWGRVPFYSLAYFVVMLLPVLGFLNIYFMRYSLVADHWQYFAIIGPIALVAAMIRQPVVAAALLLALGALTWKQCGMYSNVETLWQQTIRLNPECLIAQGNLGTTLLEEGRAAEAISHYQKALEIDPTNAEAHVNLGNALRKKGSVDEAIAQYQMALQINPSLALAHNNLGIALALHGRLDEAIMHYEKALQIQPDSAECHYSLGNVFAQQRRLDEAISHYQKALQINPNNAKAQNNLGEVLLKKGNVSEAIPHFEQALQFDPADPSIQVNMAWVLATSSEASLRNGKTAVELARQADGLTGGTNPMVLHTLAAALAEAGQFHEAVDTAQRALSLATGQSDARLAQELQIELGLYQAGSPYHLPAQTH